MIYSWKSSSYNQGGAAEEHEFNVFDKPNIFQIIMWHVKLWEDDFSQQAESSIKLKSVLESRKSETLCVWIKKLRPKRKCLASFRTRKGLQIFLSFTSPCPLCFYFQVGRPSDSSSLFLLVCLQPVSISWESYLVSSKYPGPTPAASSSAFDQEQEEEGKKQNKVEYL